MKTEQEHLRELIDIISAAKSDAINMTILIAPSERAAARMNFISNMRRATVEATSLNYYRSQRDWGLVAITLDQASKIMIANEEWTHTAALLEALRVKVLALANQRRN